MKPYMQMVKKSMQRAKDGTSTATMKRLRKQSTMTPVQFWSVHALNMGRIWQGQQGVSQDDRMTIIDKHDYALIKQWIKYGV